MALDPNVQLILGGFDSAAKGLQPRIDAEAEAARRNRPLSPYEKWLGKMLSGELSPEQAGMGAQLEARGMLPVENQPGVASPMGGLSANPNAISNMASPTEQYQPQTANRISQVSGPVTQSMPQSQGGLGSGLQGPETAGDMQALMGAAPFLRAANAGQRGTSPEDLAFRYWQEQQRTGRSQAGITSREGIAGALMEQGGQQFDQTLQYKYDALNALSQRAARLIESMNQRAGSANDLRLLSTKMSQLNSLRQARARVQANATSYASPDTQVQLQQLDQAESVIAADVEQTLNILNPKYLGPNSGPVANPTSVTQTRTETGEQKAKTPSRLNRFFGK